MRYLQQHRTIERLGDQADRALSTLRKTGRERLANLWSMSKSSMRGWIRDLYRRDFAGSEKWDIVRANAFGTMEKIDRMVGRVLEDFHRESLKLVAGFLKQMYRDTVLRQAYVLDMVTPNHVQVKLPNNRMFTEAASAKVYRGPDADTTWKVRWSSWIDSYRTALANNLKLGALNNSDVEDAADEVDASRAGSPAYDLGDALDRIYMSQSVFIQAQAASDLAEMNQEMGLEEVWQTSFSARVCDDCDAQLGLTKDEAEFDIPAHPNCECYWRLVPATWAQLLRTGDSQDRSLARYMDANGIVPGAMIIRDDDGNITSKAIVKFEDWMATKFEALHGRAS